MEWQWHHLDHMQIICTSLQTDNHANTSPPSFLLVGCPSCHPTNSIKALNDHVENYITHHKCCKIHINKTVTGTVAHKLLCCDYELVCLCLCISFFVPQFFFFELKVTTVGCLWDGDESVFTFFLCFDLSLTCGLVPSWFGSFGNVLQSMFRLDECFLFLFLLHRVSAADRPVSTKKQSLVTDFQSYACKQLKITCSTKGKFTCCKQHTKKTSVCLYIYCRFHIK